MFFDDWSTLGRILVIGVLGYAGIVFLLRISGNRTLSKLNSFDFVVTVAFGSTLSSLLIDSRLELAEGLLAFGLLVLLQFVMTWLSVRSRRISRWLKTQPTLLLADGEFRDPALRQVRITRDEIRSALRKKGFGDLRQVAAVLMESDGSLSVIGSEHYGDGSAMPGGQAGGRRPQHTGRIK